MGRIRNTLLNLKDVLTIKKKIKIAVYNCLA